MNIYGQVSSTYYRQRKWVRYNRMLENQKLRFFLSRVWWLGFSISIISIAMLENRLCIYYYCDHSWSFSFYSLVFLCLTAIPDTIIFALLLLIMVNMQWRSFYLRCCHGCLSMMMTMIVAISSAVNIQMNLATGKFPRAVEMNRKASKLD